MDKRRIITRPPGHFPRCVPLLLREIPLRQEKMAMLEGKSGNTLGAAQSWLEERRSWEPAEVRQMEQAAMWGIMPTGNTDSTRTNLREVIEQVHSSNEGTVGYQPPEPQVESTMGYEVVGLKIVYN